MSKPVDPFVQIPRRFVDARRRGEISAGAYEAGQWIACRADYRTGYHYATIEELLRELGRQHKESRELRRQLQEELHPTWVDFDVRRGQRKPWVFKLTGLRPGRDLDKSDVDSVQVTSAPTWTPTSQEISASVRQESDSLGQRRGQQLGQAQVPKEREKEVLGRAVGSETPRASEGSDEQHGLELEELIEKPDELARLFGQATPKALP